MAFNDGSRRWRDDFPQLFAAWLATQSAAHHATLQVRSTSSGSSAWTLAVLAGAMAVILGIVALNGDRSKTAPLNAIESSVASLERVSLMSPVTTLPEPLDVELAVERMAIRIPDWDERPYEYWTSTGSLVSESYFVADDWMAPQARPESDVTASQPYFLFAERRELDQFSAATASEEVPQLYASAQFNRHVGVTIERSAAVPQPDGALAYTLKVRNLDDNPVEHVRVIEAMSIQQAGQVLDTDPPAYMSSEGALIWQLADLQPLESRSLKVTLNAEQLSGPLQTIAALDVETQVSVKTAVMAAPIPEPVTEEPIVPEYAFPEPQPEPPIQPFDEPIAPALADEDVLPEPAGWNAFDPQPSSAADQPIEPLITDNEPATIAPENIVPEFKPVEPEAAPITPEEVPIVPEFAPIDLLPPARREIVDEPIEPEFVPAPAPRPVPIDPTRPPRPLLSLDARTDKAVRAGEVVTTVYEIRNEGDAPAEGVVLTVHVPPELQHKYGKEVEHRIRRLQPGESRQARLLTLASSEGTAELDAVLLLDGAAEDKSTIAVRVLNRRPTDSPPAGSR